MAAQVQSDWTVASVNGCLVATCTATTDANNLCNWTKKTPKEVDCTKKYMLTVAASAAQDGAAAPLAIYAGYSDDFALAGTTAAPTATDGAYYGQLIDDLGYGGAVAGVQFVVDPDLAVANVVTIAAVATGEKFRAPVAPYHAFSLNAASGTLLAHTLTFTIVQKTD